jgi:glycosyltransferase involved in cell wall biosynthesis
LKKAGYEVAFFCTAKENTYSEELQKSGIASSVIAPNDPSFDEKLKNIQPAFVIMDRFMIEEQFSWRVKAICPESVRILDTIDLHFLRKARETSCLEGTALQLSTPEAARELAAIYRSDLTLILSDYELQLLQSEYRIPAELLHYCSLFYAPHLRERPDFEAKRDFVCIGSFRHPPNCDSVLWLKKEIWPLIRKSLPQAELHIYGSYPSKLMMDLSDAREGLIVRGETEDAIATLARYRVLLAPLRFGAGIKGKISDMWASGGSVVTTPCGAEGMKLQSGVFGGEIAQSPQDLARAAVELYSDSARWMASVTRGSEILQKLFNTDQQATHLLGRLLETKQNLLKLRDQNHVGQILWHHTLRSTEYFSRWIEAKNRVAPPLQSF